MPVDETKSAMNRAYAFCEEQQNALDEGRITEAEWFEVHCRFFTGNYLAADNPRAQSGHGGDAAQYRYTRGMILEAIHQSGTFLDVGCANGHLMEMLHRWLGGTGLDVEFYGLDISEGLLDLARKRLPQWHDRFMLGNALYWKPESKYDFVCVAGFGVVPAAKERELADHLFNGSVADGGRMIVGPQTEPKDSCKLESKLRSWGYAPSGYCEKSHSRPELCRRMLWFDKSG